MRTNSSSLLVFILTLILLVALKGTRCELDLSKCSEYCSNNGTCTYDPNNSTGFICNCILGFSGERCEDDFSVCSSQVNPCLNGGTCEDRLGLKFECNCLSGYFGKTCEQRNECHFHPCENGGVCHLLSGNYSCACPFGYTGKICETQLKICAENPCQNGAFCLVENEKEVCYCVPDFHGPLCQYKYNECEFEPCMNGGTCVDGVAGFNCTCPSGYYGDTCSTTNECPTNDTECESSVLFSITTTTLPTILFSINTPISSEIASPIAMVSSTPMPSSVISLGSDYEVPYDPCPTLSIGDDSHLSVDSSFIDIPRSSSFISMTSLVGGNIASSERQFPDLSYSSSPVSDLSGSWPETVLASTILISIFPTRFPPHFSSFMSEPVGGLTPSYDYESSTWESFETTKVLLPTESGALQTGIPPVVPEPSSSDFVPPFETIYVTMLSSSYFPSGSSIFYNESSLSMEMSSPVDSITQEFPFASRSLISLLGLNSSSMLSSSQLDFPTESPFTSILQTMIPPEPEETDTMFISELFSTESSFSASLYSISSTSFLDFSLEQTSIEGGSISFTQPAHTATEPFQTLSDSEMFQSSYNSNFSSASASTSQPDPPSSYIFSLLPGFFSSKTSFESIITKTADFSSEFLTSKLPPQPSTLRLYSPSESFTFSSESLISLVESSSDILFSITETQIIPGDTNYYPFSNTHDYGESLPFSFEPSSISRSSPFGSEALTPVISSTVSLSIPRSLMTSEYLPETGIPTPSPSETSIPTPSLDSTTTDYYSSDQSDFLTSSILSHFTSTPSVSLTTDISPTATPTLTPPLPTNLTDPCFNYCQNNAKCESHSIGQPLCICPFKVHGERCEKVREKVIIPSFKGNSYIVYQVPTETVRVLDISMKMTTLFPDGIIMYNGASEGKIYAFIFVQTGLLTLHFSCGSQSMNFVETRTRVDNGYNFTLHFRVEMMIREQNELHCVGKLKVNESYVMSGEQLVGHQESLFDNRTIPVLNEIFIGGISPRALKSENRGDQMLAFLPGFRGCLYELSISEEERDMFDDAVDGREISECGLLGCAVNPCFGTSNCIVIDGFPPWKCVCPPGFEGSRCQIPVCLNNNCLNGATCAPTNELLAFNITNYVNDTQSERSLCLCRFGWTGAKCDQKIRIQKPSFNPTRNLAAFVSYHGIPDLGDWFQFKFHFVTKNISQIALLMYIGNKRQTEIVRNIPTKIVENVLENESDFFALSFLQGFIAATWNLGTGTQRIITPSRIDPRLGIHTLFVGRSGRVAWIKVDGMKNTTGQTVGPLYRLNVNTDLYVGGYDTFQFEGLPHDFPIHHGFQGCVFDLGFRVKNKLYLPNVTDGRNVKNCFEDDC